MKYRIKPFDLVCDIWILEERLFPLVWIARGVGKKKELEKKLNELSTPSMKVD